MSRSIGVTAIPRASATSARFDARGAATRVRLQDCPPFGPQLSRSGGDCRSGENHEA